VQYVEKIKPDETILDKSIRPPVESNVRNGRRSRLMFQTSNILIMIFQTGVVQQQRTTAAILVPHGHEESGATQWIQMCAGKNVTFRSVVSSFS